MIQQRSSAAVLLGALIVLSACEGRDRSGGSGEGGLDGTVSESETGKQGDARTETQMSAKVGDRTEGEGIGEREVATFGAGCFWCVEAVLEQVDGVIDVTSGYMGGTVPNPTYKEVCTGLTGHAEVVQVTFDPAKLPYETLLEHFWKLHDPTTLNRQGNDVGTQYRSAIFYASEEQRIAAERSKQEKDDSGEFSRPIVTEIVPAGPFYAAEVEHQDYYRQNKSQPYCRYVIAPKLEKLGLEK